MKAVPFPLSLRYVDHAMRTVRALIAALLAVGVGAPRMVRAADPEPPPPPRIGIEMTYTRKPGAEECAGRDKMEELLIGRYRYDPFDLSREEVHIVVEVTLWGEKNGQYRGRYTIAPPGQDPVAGEEVADRKCMEVLRDIASAIKYDTYLRFPAPKPEPPPEPSAPAPAPLPHAVPSAPPPAAPPRRPVGDKPKAPLSPWVVSVEPAIAFGIVSGVALGGAVNLAHRRDLYSLGVSGSWFSTLGRPAEADYFVRGSSIEGTVVPCRMVTGATWPISLSMCATLGLGLRALAIFPTVKGVEPPVASFRYLSLSAGARMQIEAVLASRVIVGGFGGLSTRVWSQPIFLSSPEQYADGSLPPDVYGRLSEPFTPVGMLGLYVGVHM